MQGPALWTDEEVVATKQKIEDKFSEYLKSPRDKGFRPGTVLRLSFHDCIRYTDGTGGCDGCLNWRGVDVERFPKLNPPQHDVPDLEEGDGGNNNLGDTARTLEELYASPLSAAVPQSLKELGKSRADFWALAGITAVEYTIKVNNEVCDSGRKPFQTTRTKQGQCLWAQDEAGCKATPSRPLVFTSGRRDCNASTFKTEKPEKHPNAHMDGKAITQYMKDEFGFSGRETVAIMGAHTIGVYHPKMTGFKYVWTPRSEMSFNNEYYRNMVLEDHWVYNNDRCTEIGDAWGQKGHSKWSVKANMFTQSAGPIQWIRMTHVCPDCHYAQKSESQWWTDDYKSCCTEGVPDGAQCRPDDNRANGSSALQADDDVERGCEKFKFLFERDHAFLNTDMGLYLDFNVDEHGFPQNCAGLETFTSSRVLNRQRGDDIPFIQGGSKRFRWADQECPKQYHAEPLGARPLYEYVEEFARNQTAWLDAFIPAMEKYLGSGYQATELQPVITSLQS